MDSSVVSGGSLQASAQEKKGLFGRKFKNVVELIRLLTLAGQIILAEIYFTRKCFEHDQIIVKSKFEHS